jgi:hypothetical protein
VLEYIRRADANARVALDAPFFRDELDHAAISRTL